MTKQEFLATLSKRLDTLPKSEIDKSISYYEEMINDRIEEGMSEDEAVAALGNMDDIVKNIMYELSIPTLMKAKVSQSKNHAVSKGIWLTCVILGFPLWFSLLLAFFVVIIALYVSVWAVIISLFAVVLSFAAAFLCGLCIGGAICFMKSIPVGLCVIGGALICGALALFSIKPVCLIAKGLVRFTAFLLRKLKSLFIGKKGAEQ